jgi:hypothetical protein
MAFKTRPAQCPPVSDRVPVRIPEQRPRTASSNIEAFSDMTAHEVPWPQRPPFPNAAHSRDRASTDVIVLEPQSRASVTYGVRCTGGRGVGKLLSRNQGRRVLIAGDNRDGVG